MEIGCHLELVYTQRSLHRLPTPCRMDNLPVVWRAHAYRHGEVLFIGTPLVHHHPGRFAKQQFQTRNLSVPQVMVEDRRQIHPALPIGLREQISRVLQNWSFGINFWRF